MTPLQLNPVETRVLGALVEKSITTPQYYPMTVNAIMLAANQKSSRNPVMGLSEGEVGSALNRLEELRLAARDDFGARVPKWRHHFSTQLLLKSPVAAVLATLMLRGPQTASELRSNAAALGGPADAEALNAALQDLADRAQPLVQLLARAPGQKEARHAHTLHPAPTLPPGDEAPPIAVRSTFEERLQALEARVAELEQRLERPAGDPCA